jgi:hypothetical protein
MLIKNGSRYYEEKEVKAYAQGYWDGRFHGVRYWSEPLPAASCRNAYDNGFMHGEADYLADDADFAPDPVFDDLDVVEQLTAHANIDPRKANRYNK